MATRSGSRGTGARAESGRWAWAALVVLLIAGAVLLLHETSGISFRDDEWNWIQYRRGGIGTLLHPYNQHLVLVGLLIYRLLFATAGLHTYLPYRLAGVAAQLGCVALVFAYARPRVGGYLAWLAALLILALGPGAEAFLWPFNDITIVLALDAGIGALLLLDRGDRAGDLGAAVLLGVALASDDVGVAIAAGVLVELVLRRRWRGLWAVAAPLALYALWFLADQQPIMPRPAADVAHFVVHAAASVMSALTGVSDANPATDAGGHFLRWGRPLLVVALVVMAWRLWRMRRVGAITARLPALAAMALVFWVTAGVGRADIQFGTLLTGTGHESRYVYVGSVLVVLIAVELARGAQAAPRWALAAVGVLVLAVTVANFGALRDEARFERDYATVERASLGAVQMTRSIVGPNFRPAGFLFSIVRTGPYLAAERTLGSPADTPAQIAAEPETVRAFVDTQLVAIHRVRLVGAGGCSGGRLAGRPGTLSVTVPAGGLLVRAGRTPAVVGVRRFGSALDSIGTVPAGSRRLLRIGPDSSSRPWQARVSGGTVSGCDGR